MSSDPDPSPAARDLHRLDFLVRAGEVLASSLDYQQTLWHVARLAVPELGDLCVVDVVEDGVLRRLATAHVLPRKRELMEALARHNPTPGESPAPAGRVLASGRTEVLEVVDAAIIASHTLDPHHAELVRALGMHSHIAVPMRVRGEVIGVLSLGITESERRYGDADRLLAEELARRAALAVEHARLYRSAQHELERRRQAEAELRLSESRFRAIMEQSPLSTQRLAPDGRTLGVNRAWEELWSLTLADIEGYSVLEDPQLEETGIAPLMCRAFEGTPTYLPTIAYDPRRTVPGMAAADDEAVRWVSAFAYPVRDDAGEIREVVLVHEDVTETRRAEERLRESEARLNRALLAGGMVVWDWNLVTGEVECSANARTFFGFDVGRAEQFVDTIDMRDRPAIDTAAARAMSTGVLDGLEYRLAQGDGLERWVSSRGQVEFAADGTPVRMLGVTVDITSRRQAEDATRMLADAGAVLGTSLDYPDTLASLARIVVPRLADWFAVDLLAGEDTLERVSVYHPDAVKLELAHALAERYPPRRGQGGVWQVIDTGQAEWAEDIPEALLRENAHDAEHARLLLALQLRSYILVPLIARGSTIGVLTLVYAESGRRYRPGDVDLARDLAARVASAVDNARLHAQLQAEHRRKDEFLATLAHELRNPLAPIRTGLGLLQRSHDPALAERVRGVMDRQLSHMVRLIDDLLDLSRVTRGVVELQLRAVDLLDVVNMAVEASRPLIDAAGLRLVLDLPQAPVRLFADDTRLAQVITNLLNNAAKFTPAGGQVSIALRPHADHLVLAVSDTGIGIATAQLEQVFEMFTRLPEARGQGGLGIGLTLSRRLVQLHGGRLWAESAGPGQGSRFLVCLPLPAAHAQAPLDATPEKAGDAVSPARRVIVVDDNADAAETLALLLRQEGHEVRSTDSADAALRLVEDFIPDVAFLDIGLPGMDGYELAQRLRADARLSGLRLVAVTGWGRAEDRAQSKAAGFDHHLTKPVDPQDVVRLAVA